jgi:hypothetical protein
MEYRRAARTGYTSTLSAQQHEVAPSMKALPPIAAMARHRYRQQAIHIGQI